MTADVPRPRFDAGRVGVGLCLALGLALIAFASGGYFPTGWAWGALVSLVVVAALLVLGTAVVPSSVALLSLGGLAGFAVWTWLALLWSDNTAATTLEGQRALLYVSGFAALLVVVRRATVPLVLAATFTAIFLASGYGLLTRLFPERLGVYDPVAAYRLEEPLTYWNALGVFAVMGALSRLASRPGRRRSRRARSLLRRCRSSSQPSTSRSAAEPGPPARLASPPRLPSSRAACSSWPGPQSSPPRRRSQSSSHRTRMALTRTDAPLSAASHDGHELAVYLILLAGTSALGGALFWFAERRVTPSRQARLAFAGVLGAVAVAALRAVVVRYGGPVSLARKGYDSFTTTSGETPVNLNRRLFTFSGSYRSELWHAAWQDYEANPLLGSGPGTYEQYWNAHRPIQHKVRDAHSLYLEVLGELGRSGSPYYSWHSERRSSPGSWRAALRSSRRRSPRSRRTSCTPQSTGIGRWERSRSPRSRSRRPSSRPPTHARACRSFPRGCGPVESSPRCSSPSSPSSASLGRARSRPATGRSRKGDYAEARSQARKSSDWWWWSPDPWRLRGDIAAEQGDTASASDYYRKAITKDEGDWKLWYDLSTVTTGEESRRALAEAICRNRYATSDFEEADDLSR